VRGDARRGVESLGVRGALTLVSANQLLVHVKQGWLALSLTNRRDDMRGVMMVTPILGDQAQR
jgi:hypothetical protein